MGRLKELVLEVHRRSLWQVLVVYLGASWGVLEAVDHVVDRFLMPEWVSGAAIVLLLIGFPIVVATAMVRETPAGNGGSSEPEVRDPTLLAPKAEPTGSRTLSDTVSALPEDVTRLLTWPKAILGGVLAFALLGLVSAFIVLQGVTRVAGAEGSAADAFAEQAWLVLAEFEASDSEAEQVATAARAALMVDLEQSQHVSLYSSNQVARVLDRMGLPDTARLDEELALEVVQREGLGGVLTAEVSRLGSSYVIASRIVEPAGGTNVVAVRAVARGDRLAEGVEKLSHELRRRLGEAADAIRRSKPLPQVTTGSLEALKKYGQAVEALDRVGAGGAERAAELAGQAIQLDSSFAMAWRLASVAYNNLQRVGQAAEYAERAYELRERLTDRERLHIEAFRHYVSGDPRQAVEAYDLLFSQYPDDSRAANNLAVTAGGWLGDRERAFEAARRAFELSGERIALGNLASQALWTGRTGMIDSLIVVAGDRGFAELAARLEVRQAIAESDWGRADRSCATYVASFPEAGGLNSGRMLCGALAVARGQLRRGRAMLETTRERFGQQGRMIGATQATITLALADEMAGRHTDVAARYDWLLRTFAAESVDDLDAFVVRSELIVGAALLERPELETRVEESYGLYFAEDHWASRYSEGVVSAARALRAGDAGTALERLDEVRRLGYEPFFWAVWTNLLSGLAFGELARHDSAVHYLERVAEHGSIGAVPSARAHLPVVLRRLAELEAARGNPDAAARRYGELLELWSDADPELAPQVTAVRGALARLTAEEAS